MRTISANHRGKAWLDAVKALRSKSGRLYNLVVEILEPAEAAEINELAQTSLDGLLTPSGNHNCNTVAETIFPAWEYLRYGVKGVYEIYPEEVFPTLQNLRANSWGTYAFRLVRRKGEDGNWFNPLERVVTKIKGEVQNSGPKRAAYELDLLGNSLSTYDPEHDWNKHMGGQCLSHISLKLGPSKELYLTALYRHQFYIQKALGNFLGLARLQSFIAHEAGVSIGPLVCHATLATLDTQSGSWGLSKIDQIISHLNDASGET